MSDEKTTAEENKNPDTGNKDLLIGGGITAYGTIIALSMSYVCPVCIIAAPTFLGIGAYKKLKHNRTHGEE